MLFTADSDAPKSNRVMYIGTDNVAAGRQAGELIKKALPNGGKIMLFVGTMDAANAHERVQGIKEAHRGHQDRDRRHPHRRRRSAKAKANVEDTLTKYPEHRSAGRAVGLQHAADLQCREGGRARRARSRSSASTRTSGR